MEKFGVMEDDLISGLRDEEHNLMLEMMKHMNGMEKTAEDNARQRQVESRLSQVRCKISDHDLKKSREGSV